MNHQTMDDLTAALLIDLQLQDTEDIFASFKGKGREGEISDAELALELYKHELDLNASVLSDRRLTKSIARAVHTDGDTLAQVIYSERTAERDREAANLLSTGGRMPSDAQLLTATTKEMDEELVAKLSALWVPSIEELEWGQKMLLLESGVDEAGDAIRQGESSLWASRSSDSSNAHFCVACQENKKFVEVIRAPCRHEYCRECLQDLFKSSMTDESLFPPRCCKTPIALTFVRIFLTADIVRQYEQKKIEFETSDRTYCSSPSCSTFIHPDNIHDNRGRCVECDTLTCTLCKLADHKEDCPADTALHQLLKTAADNGWQRCFGCRRLVELDTGCNHMTCKCGSQFCYLCGQRWKTCGCAQWDEHRLLARADQVVDREPQQRGLRLARQNRVAQAAEDLRARHNCEHETWSYIRGPHHCEECHQNMPCHIYQCTRCRLQACRRCKINRL